MFGHILDTHRKLRALGKLSLSGWTVRRADLVTVCQNLAAMQHLCTADLEKLASACRATFASGVSVADVVSVAAIACERGWLARLDEDWPTALNAGSSAAAA